MNIFDLLPSIGRIAITTGMNYALASGVRWLLSQHRNQTNYLRHNLTKSIIVDYLLYGSIAMAIVDEITQKSSDPNQKAPIASRWKEEWHQQYDQDYSQRR